MMDSNRKACLNCEREALLETIERNSGLCEVCASEIRKEEDTVEFKPVIELALSCLTWILPLMVAIEGFFLCEKAEWHLIWSLFWSAFIFALSFRAIRYLVGAICLILIKLKIGLKPSSLKELEQQQSPPSDI